jgi:hypothetical protein
MAQADDVQDVQPQDEEAAGPSNCRHCGHLNDTTSTDGDWLCPNCERYQDQMTCPTCKQPARISLMPDEFAPTPHAPVRRRKQ